MANSVCEIMSYYPSYLINLLLIITVREIRPEEKEVRSLQRDFADFVKRDLFVFGDVDDVPTELHLINYFQDFDLLQNIRPGVLIFMASSDQIEDIFKSPIWRRFAWLLPHKNADYFQQISLRLDDYIIMYETNENQTDLMEVYAIKSGPVINEKFGTWSADSGINVSQPNPFERRKNLRGAVLTNALQTWSPFSVLIGRTKATRMFPEVLETLGSILNFTVEVINPDVYAYIWIQTTKRQF